MREKKLLVDDILGEQYGLTPAEIRTLQAYVALGIKASQARLADKLKLAPSTVRNQVSSISHKLNPSKEGLRISAEGMFLSAFARGLIRLKLPNGVRRF